MIYIFVLVHLMGNFINSLLFLMSRIMQSPSFLLYCDVVFVIFAKMELVNTIEELQDSLRSNKSKQQVWTKKLEEYSSMRSKFVVFFLFCMPVKRGNGKNISPSFVPCL